MKLYDGGTVVIIALVIVTLSIINTATGGDQKGERITVTPVESK